VRQQGPRTEILVRADSGFCREPIMAWCTIYEARCCPRGIWRTASRNSNFSCSPIAQVA
jgi:hypothetical protein